MVQRRQALLAWLSHLTQTPICSISVLGDCRVFQSVLQQFSQVQVSKRQVSEGTTGNYLRMRDTYQQVLSVLKDNYSVNECSLDLFQMAQGTDEDGLEWLLQMIYFACIHSNSFDKNKLKTSIMALPEHQSLELMNLWKEGQKDMCIKEEGEEDKDKKKILQFYQKMENLQAENESLREHLVNMSENERRAEENVIKISMERDQLQKEIIERMDMMKMREESLTGKDIDQNSEIIQELKNTLICREEAFNKKIHSLEDQIQLLREEKNKMQKSIVEVEEKNKFARVDDHTNCIKISVHKRIIAEYAAKSKEASQNDINQFKYKLENVKMQNEISQLKSKLQKIQNNQGTEITVSSYVAQSLELKFYNSIRDALRAKIDQNISSRSTIEEVDSKLDHFQEVK